MSCHTQKSHPSDWNWLKTLYWNRFQTLVFWVLAIILGTLIYKRSSSSKFMRLFFWFRSSFHFFNGRNFSHCHYYTITFPKKIETFHLKHFFLPFFGRNFIISLCELTQMWNYTSSFTHLLYYSTFFKLHRLCLLVFTRSLPFNKSTTVTDFLDCQRKLQQHNVRVIQDVFCVKTSYEHISQLQHMVLCEKRNQHKSAITATLQKACEKGAHLHRETKHLIIWWGSSYFPESNWRVII